MGILGLWISSLPLSSFAPVKHSGGTEIGELDLSSKPNPDVKVTRKRTLPRFLLDEGRTEVLGSQKVRPLESL